MIQVKKQSDSDIKSNLNHTIDLTTKSNEKVFSRRQERIKQMKRKTLNRFLLFVWYLLLSFALLFIVVSLIVNKIYASDNKSEVKQKSVVIEKQMTTKTTKQFTSIKEILWFDWCKTIQTEEQHILKWHWSVFAMDVRCTKWVSDKVYAPLWKDVYKIEEIWFDKRLWNYIILKHAEYRFVFWHTETGFKVWDKVKAWTHIGNTDKSWTSENFHLHFELWKNDYNISYKEMLWENTLFNMEHTYDLRKQRWWYIELQDTMNWLKDLEWFRSCPYPDNNRYSIGYGTISKKGNACITKEQAIELKRWNVDDILRVVYQNYFVPYHNQRIALASMLYNRWKNSRIVRFHYRKTESWMKAYLKEFIKHNTSEKYVKWITKRVIDHELKLYLNKF